MISVILSGGSGTRLWPLSRQKLPKQFNPLFADTLFATTAKRLQSFGEVMVCTGESLRVLTEKSIKKDRLKVKKVFYEPMARNTAPAIGLICRYLQIENLENEIVGIFPADHWIDRPENFKKAIHCAEVCAQDGQIVTLGIEPHYAATGFGYIDCHSEVFKEASGYRALKVNGFVEKPNLAKAKEYLKEGHYSWNSGMFIFKVETMITALKKHMPHLWEQISSLRSDLSNLGEIYQKLEGQSIDYGVMEKADNLVCVPCDIGWSDLGSWDDVQGFQDKITSEHNQATTFRHQCKDSFAFSIDKKAVCFLGADGIQVVNTPDVLYVGKAGRSQEIKELLEKVREKQPLLAIEHRFEDRPWGFYKNLHEEDDFKVKVITVDPGQQFSYQSHNRRSETWVVVRGEGEVVLNDNILPVKKGTVIEIPMGAKHRMRNLGSGPLSFVEVQQGDYFGEDDIIRYQDDYNRA